MKGAAISPIKDNGILQATTKKAMKKGWGKEEMLVHVRK